MRNFHAILLGVVCLGVTSCSRTPDGAVLMAPPDSIEIYFARASLFKSPEFESYKLLGRKLYMECGTVSSGRHAVSSRSLFTLTEEEVSTVHTAASEVVSRLGGSRVSLDEPGDGRGFADPGIFEAKILSESSPLTVRTSFDSVSTGEGAPERRLRTFAQAVRGTAVAARKRDPGADPLPCGNSQFFGLR